MARTDRLALAMDEYEAHWKLFQLAWPDRSEERYINECLVNDGYAVMTPAEAVLAKIDLTAEM